jgi:lipopolysaccharide/colanic/teichoic acid biosynthesis glycosyltransferase
VFYKQERVGKDGKLFNILKFRSMRPDAEKDGAKWATKNDNRVTGIGNFIRKYRIDELPQLLNVIKGEMSFIGPRPERPQFVQQLIKEVPYYNQRHNVKPGLAGWAQLNYPYGASVNDSLEKLKFDLYYVKHQSLLLDILILIRTVEVVLFGKGR